MRGLYFAFCLIVVLPLSSGAASNEWYSIIGGLECHKFDPEKAYMMSLAFGQRVEVKEEREAGVTVYIHMSFSDGSKQEFYRGLNRCNENMRKGTPNFSTWQ